MHSVLLLVGLSWLGAVAAQPAPVTNDLTELKARARAQGLAVQKPWLRLGHYHPTLSGGYRSEADGAPFFLAPDGKDDPAAELEATLAALLAPPVAGENHARCRFPARLTYLASALGVDVGQLPPVECTELEKYRARMAAQSVTLVFSSYYVNNPASAFGHTFLRFNKEPGKRGERHELLDYGVDYAGVVDTSNALLYGLKGLTGLFEGRFNHYPYFYKVREYNEYESRDLWEYELSLTPAQLSLLIDHLWEGGGTYFDYYYLSQNCSYRLLAVLEAAAPELDLVGKQRFYVLPSETVKTVHATPGLVRAVHYRPSIRSQFRARASTLSSDELDHMEAVVEDPAHTLDALPPERQVAVLDTALDYVDLREAKALVHGTSPEASERKQRLMERRSQVLRPSAPLVLPPPTATQPQFGHAPLRAGMSAGYSSTDGALTTYRFRFALRDLADPASGYPELTQYEFGETRLRAAIDTSRVSLEEFTVVRIQSLSPLDRFNMAPSWTVRLGSDRLRDGGCDNCYAGSFDVGGGLAYSWADNALTLFAMTEGSLHAGTSVPGVFGTSVRPSIAPRAGLRLRMGPRATLLTSARWHVFFESDKVRTGWSAQAVQRLHLTDSFGLNLEYTRHASGEHEAGLGGLIYF